MCFGTQRGHPTPAERYLKFQVQDTHAHVHMLNHGPGSLADKIEVLPVNDSGSPSDAFQYFHVRVMNFTPNARIVVCYPWRVVLMLCEVVHLWYMVLLV